jgi:hypothetical protein
MLVLWAFCLSRKRDLLPNSSPWFRESIIYALLFLCVEIWFFTEGLSFLRCLNATALSCLYFCSAVILGILLLRRRKRFIEIIRKLRTQPSNPSIRRIIIGVGILVILPLAFVTFNDPPHTPDAMTYHLPRVFHWIQNKNIEHYPCDEPRQIFFPPFSEYIILQLEMLSGNDYFDNTVQLGMLFGVFILASLLGYEIGLNTWGQTFSFLILLGSPILLVQSVQPQTDVTATFFFLGFLYFGIKSFRITSDKTDKIDNWGGGGGDFVTVMGIFVSLGINTKLTVAVFAIPFCIWFGFGYLRKFRHRVLPIYLILIFLFILFNAPFFIRNYTLCGSPFGSADLNQIVINQEFGIKTTVSNALRYFGYQLLCPWQELNELNVILVQIVHDLLGISWNDPKTTFIPVGSSSNDSIYHYTAIFYFNDIQLGHLTLLLFLCFASYCCFQEIFRQQLISEKNEYSIHPAIFMLLLFLGFLFFCFLFRWQVCGSRLLLPYFAATSPFIAFYLMRHVSKPKTELVFCLIVSGAVCSLCTLYGSLTYDPVQSFITQDVTTVSPQYQEKFQTWLKQNGFENQVFVMTNYRLLPMGKALWAPEIVTEFEYSNRSLSDQFYFLHQAKYFRTIPFYTPDYLTLVKNLKKHNTNKIGFHCNTQSGAFEYSIMRLLKNEIPSLEFRWVFYSEEYQKTANYRNDFIPEVIIFENIDFIFDLQKQYILGDLYVSNAIDYVIIRGKREKKTSIIPP